MDHIQKALEKSQTTDGATSVRDWMQPVRDQDVNAATTSAPVEPLAQDSRKIELDAEVLKRNHIVTAENTSNPLIDRYRLLRTRVRQLMKGNDWNLIGITSPTPQAGKTLTSTNLAITMAKAENHQVFLIDADLRRPSIGEALGFQAELGLVDYLRGNASLADVQISPSTLPQLTVIPGRPTSTLENPSELLSSLRFETLTRHLRGMSQTATVIVDTPPLYLGDDVLAVAPRVDCMLLILEEGRSTSDELAESARLLADYNLIGTVLNKSTEKPRKFETYYQSFGDERGE